jgi:hypothetical protein
MTSDLEVHADAVRDSASALARTSGDVSSGATPPPAPAGPRWKSSAAVESLAEATRRELVALAEDVEVFRRAVLSALDDYDAADERAAGRLRSRR